MKNKINRTIDRDMLTSLLPSFLGTHILDDFIGFFIDTYIAVVLGRLTDAIFTHDAEYLKSNIIVIALCLVFKIFCEPMIFAFFSARSVYGSCDFTRKLLSHYLRKPYTAISGNQAGDIPSRIDSDIMDFVREKLGQTANRILLPIFTVYLFVILWQYNHLYSIIALLATAITYVTPIAVRKILAKFDEAERKYRSSMHTAETELASYACYLKVMGLETRLMNKMQSLFDNFLKETRLKRIRCETGVNIVCQICQIAAQIVIIIAGAFLLSEGKISFGEIAAMLSLVGSMTFLLDKASSLITVKPILANIYDRLRFFCDGEEETKETLTAVIESENIVECKGVTAKYDDKVVFENLTLTVPRNKITLLKGANGSGKSTLVSMICGFERASSGKILLNGREQGESSCNFISLSSQSSTLFKYAGVQENIMLGFFGRENQAKADGLITKFSLDCLKDRTTTENLSGGEAQKAKILRALLKEADLLILDEPENNLDVETVRLLADELKREKKSILIVSHFSTFDEIADCIVKI